MPPPYQRYVALGDSSTEGLGDPDGAGGLRGWADRLAEHLADVSPGLRYANLAVRSRTTAQILDEQLPVARALRPDLSTVVVGMNDLLRPGFDADAIGERLATMLRALVGDGAEVWTLTLPDVSRRLRLPRSMTERTRALNASVRRQAAACGAGLLDLEVEPLVADPRLWSDDRLHASALGHARLAHALAEAVGVPGVDGSWRHPLPPRADLRRRDRARGELAWLVAHVAPWAWRRVRGRTSGDHLRAKRPVLAPPARRRGQTSS